MIPKPRRERLSNSMQSMNTNWQTSLQPPDLAALGTQQKESKLKLSLETRNRGDVMIVHCQGRIVYRDEAAALSRVVSEILDNGGKVVLDLSGVSFYRQCWHRRTGFPAHLGAIPKRGPQVCQSQPTRPRPAGSYQPGFSPRDPFEHRRSAGGVPARRSLRRLLIRFVQYVAYLGFLAVILRPAFFARRRACPERAQATEGRVWLASFNSPAENGTALPAPAPPPQPPSETPAPHARVPPPCGRSSAACVAPAARAPESSPALPAPVPPPR